LRPLADIRFAAKATELLRCREMTRSANSRHFDVDLGRPLVLGKRCYFPIDAGVMFNRIQSDSLAIAQLPGGTGIERAMFKGAAAGRSYYRSLGFPLVP
jgi:hypothetical protein